MPFEKFTTSDLDIIKKVQDSMSAEGSEVESELVAAHQNQNPYPNRHPVADPARPSAEAPVWRGPETVEQPKPKPTSTKFLP